MKNNLIINFIKIRFIIKIKKWYQKNLECKKKAQNYPSVRFCQLFYFYSLFVYFQISIFLFKIFHVFFPLKTRQIELK